jgi:hypothetical protein
MLLIAAGIERLSVQSPRPDVFLIDTRWRGKMVAVFVAWRRRSAHDPGGEMDRRHDAHGVAAVGLRPT